MPPPRMLDPITADAVASVLRMVTNQLNLTAAKPDYAPLVRRRLRDAVGHLIELCDALDGDCDLEATNDDEPSLGWASDRGPTAWDSTDDRERDVGDEPEARDPDFEKSARETHGRGFPPDPTRDDDEDSHDAEQRSARTAGGAGA